ncbi:XDD4 family exosortase-dependent surface protein [Gloeothece verrucosa]|uniref:PEP-CTERM protein-sorting domain-containing protein n=1 Tax=Gloeothece verrucosa (strain PCC 7822) TaxID=497965 RepID=E0UJQ2_GLOV7|nr:XDD4 family exosortase-dependent surface protein [Gloeothece verrucosa]ADN12296.1 conserved hypothetical protein [Gloeothece verrucosa PCC 7822]
MKFLNQPSFVNIIKPALWIAGVALSPVLLAWQTPVQAASISVTGTGTNSVSSNSLSAKATFDDSLNPGKLTITLENLNPVSKPSDVLTGVFWDLTGNPSLSLFSATAPTVINGNNTATNVNLATPKLWGFSSTTVSTGLGGNASPQVTQHYGLGTAGFGITPGFHLSEDGGTQQFNYGIIKSVNADANNPVKKGTFVKDSVTFVLSNLPADFKLNSIKNVRFQYGTDLSEPSLSNTNAPAPSATSREIPEPSTIVGLALFLSGLMLTRQPKSLS